MSDCILTHCAHCAHSRLSIPKVWLGLSGVANFFYCGIVCWNAGPREYGLCVQNRDLRGEPLPAFVVSEHFLATAARSSICAVYQAHPMRLPVDSPAHIRAQKAEGEIGIRRLLRAG